MKTVEALTELLQEQNIDIQPDEEITNYMDSFELLTFLIEIEERFGVKIMPEDFAGQSKTIETFAKIIDEKR